VEGRVQGVWYRASTREQAQQLGLNGYARNLPDGRVEVLACGAVEAVAQLQEWLWQGPTAAKVTAVECSEVVEDIVPGFTTA
jgi:acylphosphatase